MNNQQNKNAKSLGGVFFVVLFMVIVFSFVSDVGDDSGLIIFSFIIPIIIFVLIVFAAVKYGKKNLNGDTFNGNQNDAVHYDDRFKPTNTPRTPTDPTDIHKKNSDGVSSYDKNVDRIAEIDKKLIELREQYNSYKIPSDVYYAAKENLEKQLAALKNKIV